MPPAAADVDPVPEHQIVGGELDLARVGGAIVGPLHGDVEVGLSAGSDQCQAGRAGVGQQHRIVLREGVCRLGEVVQRAVDVHRRD